MPVVNYHHTLEALKIIKSDIKRIAKIVSVTIQILFILYYAYLIVTNVEQPHYLITYSCLLGVSLLIFVLSIILYSKHNIDRKIEYKNKKKKRLIILILNFVKHGIKAATIVLAFIDISRNNGTDLAIILAVCSSVLLLLQILGELILVLVFKYLDYLRIGFERDLDTSSVTKVFSLKNTVSKAFGKAADKQEGVTYYTEEEQKIADELDKRAEQAIQEKKKKDNEDFKNNTSRFFHNLFKKKNKGEDEQ